MFDSPEDAARRLARVKALESAVKRRYSDVRTYFFDHFTEECAREDWRLPTDSITIPYKFWINTSLTPEQFFETRYPGWEIISQRDQPEQKQIVYVLRKKPQYGTDGFNVQFNDREFKVERQVPSPSPSIDWDSLKSDRPDLFAKLAMPVTSYELNEDAFNELYAEDPSVVAVLRRHTLLKVIEPRLSARLLKEKDDE